MSNAAEYTASRQLISLYLNRILNQKVTPKNNNHCKEAISGINEQSVCIFFNNQRIVHYYYSATIGKLKSAITSSLKWIVCIPMKHQNYH